MVGSDGASSIETEALARSLRAVVSGGVRFDAQARGVFASDASNYRIPPLGVVFPRSADEVRAALAACREAGASVVPRGSGTSIAGQAVGPGVVIDCSRHLDAILSVDPVARSAVVEPGVVLDDLQRAVRPYGLRFGPDPATHNRCTLGGMIGNNSCGSHSLRYGKTDDNVTHLSIATYDGADLGLSVLGGTTGDAGRARALDRVLGDLVATSGDVVRAATRETLRRRVSGYGLAHLLPENGGNLAAAFVGTEGTCGLILDATVGLVELPHGLALLVLGFPDAYAAADAVPEIVAESPLTVEGMDRRIVELASRSRRPAVVLPDGDAFLFVEVDGDSDSDARSKAERMARTVAGPGRAARVLDPTEAVEAWRIREDGSGLATRLADGTEAWSGFEDAAVPPERLGAYLREFDALLDAHGLQGIPYGHYGEGCIHIRIDFDLLSVDGVAGYRRFMEEAADLVSAFGGSLSGEHGDGQARGELLSRMYQPEMLATFATFKVAFDPEGGMNPGRGIDPRPLDEDLRVFDLRPRSTAPTILGLGDDGHDLGAAARRCVGVGRCRRLDGGSMCPSFQVTRDEEHSTRGRARLIGEMLNGDLADEGWRSDALREALDLCLGCKACRVECPVGVDMATYRVEFLAHHYRHRIRPRSHYAFGYLPIVLRVAGLAPRMVNALLAQPSIGRWLRRVGGIAEGAALPKIGGRSATPVPPRRRGKERGDRVRFADCFTRFVDPEAAEAADEVLEALGLACDVVGGATCCGLTWYSTGQLGIARRVLGRTVKALRRSGSGPIVVLEPSCAAMLRDEAPSLLGEDVADVSSRVVTLAEVIAPLGLEGRGVIEEPVVAQIHCHAYAGAAYRSELECVVALGGTLAAVETACCGLAGNFGLEAGHEEVARAIAERHIVKTLSGAPRNALIMADGFSCRTQIAAVVGRTSRHFAVIVRDALRRGDLPRPPTSEP